jgi:hypothetical protein
MILTGYSEKGEFHLLSPKKYHMFKRDIIIEGEIIAGSPVFDVDWVNLSK